MATPSDIPNHPLVQMVDYQGDAFPTGASYFIKNLCSNYYQTLAFNHNVPGALTCTAQADPDCKWLIQYENNDRSKIALKSARTGRYLAITSSDGKAPLGLSEQMVWWWVYQGGAPGTYWLGSSQSKDCFMHTWDCRQEEGSLVASFTNRDPKTGSFYNAPYSMFEDWSAGMSWGLDPTPELVQWKEQQKASPQAQPTEQGSEELKKKEEDLAAKERQLQEREAKLKEKEQAIEAEQKDLSEKEAAFDKKSQDFEKSYDELKKREENVHAAEERVKKSKKGGKADLLATQEEKDKLQADLKDMESQLESAKEQIKQLEQQAPQTQSPQGGGMNKVSLKLGTRPFSIRAPEQKHPLRKVPAIKTPERKTPSSTKPGQHLPAGYSGSMMERFEAGKKAMSVKA